jgi:hypothetical protein
MFDAGRGVPAHEARGGIDRLTINLSEAGDRPEAVRSGVRALVAARRSSCSRARAAPVIETRTRRKKAAEAPAIEAVIARAPPELDMGPRGTGAARSPGAVLVSGETSADDLDAFIRVPGDQFTAWRRSVAGCRPPSDFSLLRDRAEAAVL